MIRVNVGTALAATFAIGCLIGAATGVGIATGVAC